MLFETEKSKSNAGGPVPIYSGFRTLPILTIKKVTPLYVKFQIYSTLLLPKMLFETEKSKTDIRGPVQIYSGFQTLPNFD